MLFLNLMKQNPLPVDAKFVAHGIEIRCPCFFKTMGNVFQKDGQCFWKGWAMFLKPIFTPDLHRNGAIGSGRRARPAWIAAPPPKRCEEA